MHEIMKKLGVTISIDEAIGVQFISMDKMRSETVILETVMHSVTQPSDEFATSSINDDSFRRTEHMTSNTIISYNEF